MTNIFITACYEVKDRYGNTNSSDYRKLTKLSLDSFLKNLKDITQVRILEGSKDNYHELFKHLYWEVKDVYLKNQPCNILFVDSDTACLQPVSIFDKFNKFAMFNTHVGAPYKHSYQNPTCLSLSGRFNPWMMANIRYYPSGLPDFIWDVGDDLAYSWIDEWAYDCIIYNAMFHSQGITNFDEYHNPKWNNLILGGISDQQINDSEIIHCAATRGSSLSIENINKALGRS
jgi:hypothetical protein